MNPKILVRSFLQQPPQYLHYLPSSPCLTVALSTHINNYYPPHFQALEVLGYIS